MNIPLFDPVSQALIQNWDQSIEKQIQIKLITPDHAEDPQFINFTTQFAKETSHLWVEPQKKESDLPGFLLTENIIYSALPLKKELAPFLEALSQINGPPLDLSKALGQALERIDVPVRLTLYIALECPHCPHVVRTLIPLALNCTHINLHIIDGSLFPQTAQKTGSCPCPA